MIDFQNASFIKLTETNDSSISNKLSELLIDNESVIASFKGIRDYVAFTNKRIVAVNVQGITGKKNRFHFTSIFKSYSFFC